eukprot:TRINITY_DN2621_c0_g1_i5.p2 TRINITY_DN2621_c0_g1~~TRINITY_DN2621_c0_g1_i5.p2  ORF type:complete len:129 (+),score=30.02 TRINITY_DN2621_c0_g1_i5:325-711(+)
MRGNKPVVKLDGQSRGFTWTHVEAMGGGGGGGDSEKKSGGGGKLSIGDKCRVRDNEKEDWKTGTVTDWVHMDVLRMRGSKPVVKLDGQSRGFTWRRSLRQWAVVGAVRRSRAVAAAGSSASVDGWWRR